MRVVEKRGARKLQSTKKIFCESRRANRGSEQKGKCRVAARKDEEAGKNYLSEGWPGASWERNR